MLRCIKAEWRKLWYPRKSKIFFPAAVVICVLFGLILSLTTRITQGKGIEELTAMQIISANLLSVDAITILLTVYFAMAAGREFARGTIHPYLLATPSRTQYFIAKAAVSGCASLAVGAVVALLSLGVGSVVAGSADSGLALTGEIFRFAVGCLAMPPVYVLLSLCFVFFSRSAAGGIAASLVVLFLPFFAGLLPERFGRIVTPLLPASAIHSLSGVAEVGRAEQLSIPAALLVLCGWIILWAVCSLWKFHRRDI